MKLIGISILVFFMAGAFCSSKVIPQFRPKQFEVIVDSPRGKALKDDSLTPIERTIRTVPKNTKPILGYRFVIRGDFDGDGRQDTLTEHFVSLLTGQETNKYYDSLADYGQLVALTARKEPYSFVSGNDRRIDTLNIWRGGQVLGLSYLKNEGDLDGDGSDEVSYVVNWADWSSLNTCHLMTYKHHKWKEMYNFDIWDWQIPQLPQFTAQYGLFGVAGMVSTADDDTLNMQLQKELDAWPGFIKKVSAHKIRVIYRNWASEMDSAIVDLRHPKRKKD